MTPDCDIAAVACVHIAATLAPERLDAVWLAEPDMREHADTGGAIAVEGRR